jgi:pimeloyl-ACP methyl ester carboxylesterase
MAVRRAPGPLRPFLLVHGLASNARLWDGVARRLSAAGHEVVAVDQRGHGLSEVTEGGYDTATAASDLADLITSLGWTGDRAPVVAGQSWGGNVVLTLAAEHGGVAALALVDGGWIHLSDRFPTFEECWEQLEPPVFDGWTRASLEERARSWNSDWPEEGRLGALANFGDQPDGTVRPHLSREHHRSIVHSLWLDDPRPLYARVHVPTLLMAAVDAVPVGRTPVTDAGDGIAAAEIQWYVGAHHDLHAQLPDRCTADLLALAARVDG